jgi:hypothetical protein
VPPRPPQRRTDRLTPAGPGSRQVWLQFCEQLRGPVLRLDQLLERRRLPPRHRRRRPEPRTIARADRRAREPPAGGDHAARVPVGHAEPGLLIHQRLGRDHPSANSSRGTRRFRSGIRAMSCSVTSIDSPARRLVRVIEHRHHPHAGFCIAFVAQVHHWNRCLAPRWSCVLLTLIRTRLNHLLDVTFETRVDLLATAIALIARDCNSSPCFESAVALYVDTAGSNHRSNSPYISNPIRCPVRRS